MPNSREVVLGNELPSKDSPMLPPLIRSVRKAHQAEVTTLKNQLLKSHGRPPCTYLSSFSPLFQAVTKSCARPSICIVVTIVGGFSMLQGTERTDGQLERHSWLESLVSTFHEALNGQDTTESRTVPEQT